MTWKVIMYIYLLLVIFILSGHGLIDFHILHGFIDFHGLYRLHGFINFIDFHRLIVFRRLYGLLDVLLL